MATRIAFSANGTGHPATGIDPTPNTTPTAESLPSPTPPPLAALRRTPPKKKGVTPPTTPNPTPEPEPAAHSTPTPTISTPSKAPSSPAKAVSSRRTSRPSTPRPATSKARLADLRRKIAVGVGGVGVGILTLSVVHCTEAIGLLTGSPWYLSALLAVGIDAGMVLSELSELAAESLPLQRWSRAYIGLSIALSMGLNAYAFGMHSEVVWAGVTLGFVLPILVLMLGRIAGHLAK